MRIAFDGTTLTPGRTGVGYYTEHLLQHLAREVAATGDEIVVVSNQPIDTQAPLPKHVRVHDGHRFPVRIGWMQLRAARALESLQPDVAHFTNYTAPLRLQLPYVVTVHDMSLALLPWCYTWKMRLIVPRVLPRVARRARIVLTPSAAPRDDVVRLPIKLVGSLAAELKVRGAVTLFPRRTACGRVVVAAPSEAVHPFEEPDDTGLGGFGVGTSTRFDGTRWTVDAGTTTP